MIKKRASFILLLFALAGLMIGCSHRKSEKTKLLFAHWEGYEKAGREFLQEIIDGFEKENPDIEIKSLNITTRYDSKLLTMIAGGVAPDIFETKPSIMGEFMQRGVCLNITSYVRKSKVLNKKDFFPFTLYPYQYNGRIFGAGDLFGLPKDWSPDTVLFYNKDVFDQAGISYPTESWSWSKFQEVAINLTKRGKSGRMKQIGVVINPSIFWQTLPFIYQNGGRVFTEDCTRCLLDSKKAIEAVQFIVNLVTKYGVAPSVSDEQALKGTV